MCTQSPIKHEGLKPKVDNIIQKWIKLLKNDSKVSISPPLSMVSYYLGKYLCLLIYLIVSGRVHDFI